MRKFSAWVIAVASGFILCLGVLPAVSAAQVTVSGSLTVSGNGSAGNAALKNASADAVQYVSSTGSDSNDGLSPGTARATIGAAVTAITSGGRIYVSGGSYTFSATVADGGHTVAIYLAPGTTVTRTSTLFNLTGTGSVLVCETPDPWRAPAPCALKEAESGERMVVPGSSGVAPEGQVVQGVAFDASGASGNSTAIYANGGPFDQYRDLLFTGFPANGYTINLNETAGLGQGCEGNTLQNINDTDSLGPMAITGLSSSSRCTANTLIAVHVPSFSITNAGNTEFVAGAYDASGGPSCSLNFSNVTAVSFDAFDLEGNSTNGICLSSVNFIFGSVDFI